MNKHERSPTSHIPRRVELALSVIFLLIAALPNGPPASTAFRGGLYDSAASDRLRVLTADRLLLYSLKRRICDDG